MRGLFTDELTLLRDAMDGAGFGLATDASLAIHTSISLGPRLAQA